MPRNDVVVAKARSDVGVNEDGDPTSFGCKATKGEKVGLKRTDPLRHVTSPRAVRDIVANRNHRGTPNDWWVEAARGAQNGGIAFRIGLLTREAFVRAIAEHP